MLRFTLSRPPASGRRGRLALLGAVTALALITGTAAAQAAPAASSALAVASTVGAAAGPTAGTGTAKAHAATVRGVHPGPSATATQAAAAAQARADSLGRTPLPVRPSTGVKTVAASTASTANTVPGASRGALVTPLVAPPVNQNFDGTTLGQSGCGCQPPDPNDAVGNTDIVEMVNTFLSVYDKSGSQQCGITLNSFLNTTDSLSDPRVMWDNVNNRYIFTLTVVPASTTAAAALWLGASQGATGCGGWWIYRITFSGGSYPAGTLLDYPILGQDRNAMLFGTSNFTPANTENFTVFGIPKSAVYSGAGFSFGAFNTASQVAPVTNGGIPMISTTFSYFLGSVPGTGYRLYRLTNSGGSGATLTLQATISSPFNAPSRRVNQPGTTTTLDPLDGRIDWSPVNDGSFIWFAHGMDISGFPGIRYGAITISSNAITTAMAFRSGTSDDFNPSVGIGNAPGGGNDIYLNWAYTDTPNNVATSDTVDSVLPGGGVPNLIGTGVVLVNGSSTAETRFGDFSSVSIDPTVAAGSCAVTANQYFASDGTWKTRIARVGTC